MLDFNSIISAPVIAGAIAAAPLAVAAVRGISALRRLRRVQQVRRVDWRWRWARFAAAASAIVWLGGAVWMLVKVAS